MTMKALLLSTAVISALLLLVLPSTVVGILFLAFLAIDVLVFKDIL